MTSQTTYLVTNVTNSKLLKVPTSCLWVAAIKWHIDTLGAYTLLPQGGKVYLSHLLVSGFNSPGYPNVTKGLTASHANGDIYDYSLDNLITTQYTPQQLKKATKFKSGYRGVSWDTSKNKWCAQLTLSGKRVLRSLHESELEAALAYNSAVLTHLGPSSGRLNKIQVT